MKLELIQKLKVLYKNGENIIQYLNNGNANSIEDILISYDLQAGSYIKNFSKNREFNEKYCGALASIIGKMDDISTVMEAGVGEATTLNTVMKGLQNRKLNFFGFDISWSRLKFANALLKDFDFKNVTLFAANLFEIPLLDNSIDVVYTSHSIEPNGGREEEALKELYRVASRYLILLEPAYEFAGDEAKARMEKHGYVTSLYSTALKLNYDIIEHRLFDYSLNPLNPTGILIIKKQERVINPSQLVCPVTKTELIWYNDFLLYSKESCLAYPVVDEIPCLLRENSILASHLLTDYSEFKAVNNIK